MAQINYEVSQQIGAENNSNTTLPKFFSLKTDGNEAVVRIMHDTTASFEIMTFHEIQTSNGKFRKVNCIRDPREPLENCPLCNSGSKIKQSIFIHMIQYVNNGQGMIIPQPVVWERSISYAEKLKGYIDNYGPLSDIICKIVRHGAAGDRQTTYDIIPNLNKQIYTDVQYPKIENAFDNYKALGTIVLDKDFNDLDMFIKTGQFPVKENNNQVNQSIPPANYAPTTPSFNSPVYEAPEQNAPVSFPAYDMNPTRTEYNIPASASMMGTPLQPAWTGGYTNNTTTPVNSVPETAQQVARPIRHY